MFCQAATRLNFPAMGGRDLTVTRAVSYTNSAMPNRAGAEILRVCAGRRSSTAEQRFCKP